jgi:hypothetical protein
MSLPVSKSQISDFFAHPVWTQVIHDRLEAALAGAESQLENPDPFTHGIGVGKRQWIRAMLAWPKTLKDEAK